MLIHQTIKCGGATDPHSHDVARIVAIAHAAYVKYVPRIGREPPPMVADFAAEIAAGHAVVLQITGTVEGYLISWPKTEAYFIDNIAVDPAHQGLGLGRQLMDYAVREAKRHNLSVTMTENLTMYAHMGSVETHRVLETPFNIETGLPRGLHVSDAFLRSVDIGPAMRVPIVLGRCQPRLRRDKNASCANGNGSQGRRQAAGKIAAAIGVYGASRAIRSFSTAGTPSPRR